MGVGKVGDPRVLAPQQSKDSVELRGGGLMNHEGWGVRQLVNQV